MEKKEYPLDSLALEIEAYFTQCKSSRGGDQEEFEFALSNNAHYRALLQDPGRRHGEIIVALGNSDVMKKFVLTYSDAPCRDMIITIRLRVPKAQKVYDTAPPDQRFFFDVDIIPLPACSAS